MSSPRRKPPTGLWSRLALFRDRQFCLADWRRHFRDDFGAIAPLLTALPGTVAATYPDPDTGLPLLPRLAPDGTYTAFPDDARITRIDPVPKIDPSALVRRQIAWRQSVCTLVADALGLATRIENGPLATPWVLQIGRMKDAPPARDALLLVARDTAEAMSWLRPLLKGTPCCFVVTVHDPVIETLLVNHGHSYVALDRDTTFRASGRKWRLAPRRPSPAKVPTATSAVLTRIQRVKIVGRFDFVEFADGTRVDFRRSAKRRAFLPYLLDCCERANDFVFKFHEISAAFDRTEQPAHFESTSMRYGLFRDFAHFDRFFETIDPHAQEYRLLIRRRTH